MEDEQILNSMLQDIDDMSDEELIKALRDAPDTGLGEVLGDPFEWLSTDRREILGKRMNEQKLECPECNTRQVQSVGYINTKPAKWRCRHCKHNFEWEGD